MTNATTDLDLAASLRAKTARVGFALISVDGYVVGFGTTERAAHQNYLDRCAEHVSHFCALAQCQALTARQYAAVALRGLVHAERLALIA